jgi:hypothetical protein
MLAVITQPLTPLLAGGLACLLADLLKRDAALAERRAWSICLDCAKLFVSERPSEAVRRGRPTTLFIFIAGGLLRQCFFVVAFWGGGQACVSPPTWPAAGCFAGMRLEAPAPAIVAMASSSPRANADSESVPSGGAEGEPKSNDTVAPQRLLAASAAADAGNSTGAADGDAAAVSSSRSCRDLLTGASAWYGRAKEFVPSIAQPVLQTLEARVGAKLEQYPAATKRVEEFMDGLVIPAAEAAAASVKTVATTTGLVKAKWHAPPTPSQVAYASAVTLAAFVDRVVDATLPAKEGLADGIAALSLQEGRGGAAEAAPSRAARGLGGGDQRERGGNGGGGGVGGGHRGGGEEGAQGVASREHTAAVGGDGTTIAGSHGRDDPGEAGAATISALARNIAGKVYFRMQQRLEAAKGRMRARTAAAGGSHYYEHAVNMVQYARSLLDDQQYASLASVLQEAAIMAQQAQDVVVETIGDAVDQVRSGARRGRRSRKEEEAQKE